MNTLPKYFRIAAYGCLIQKGNLLLCKEHIQNKDVIKLPGGGLQFGEGLKDALQREFKEELDIEIEIQQHLYTTDFYVQSAFHKEYQVIAVYYTVSTKNKLPTHSFSKNNILFMWHPLAELNKNIVTFDTDKKAIEILLQTIIL